MANPGTADPIIIDSSDSSQVIVADDITLRDLLAAFAMHAAITESKGAADKHMARFCYAAADLMLEERMK